MLAGRTSAVTHLRFQSAPAIAGGRCPVLCRHGRQCARFNPRPPLLAGDARWPPARGSWPARFNPRPPLLAGDAATLAVAKAFADVSIRARHCWRAMPRALQRLATSWKFQSAPAIAGGRCASRPTMASRCACFNPRPPLLAGDAGPARRRRGRHHCFNPRPPLLAGDAPPPASRRRISSFNPRPPLLAGDAPAMSARKPIRKVSIRARHCWRAMLAPGASRNQGQESFNPRPPLLAGDAGRTSVQTADKIVSIRARHCWRAMPPTPPNSFSARPFQSAPAIAGGRCLQPPAPGPHDRRFNPRPPLLAGDAALAKRSNLPGGVSIRARHCWRAMRAGAKASGTLSQFQSAPAIAGGRCHHYGCWSCRLICFNPRPPLLAGDASIRAGVLDERDVSIRARHCWRAMRRRPPPMPTGRAVSIRARHCWRAMPTSAATAAPPSTFQSAPAIAGGRCRGRWHGDKGLSSFNPRPPLLAGDARKMYAGLLAISVSIRARHCWRAMPAQAADRISDAWFQSAPAIAGGRCASLPMHCKPMALCS